MNDGKIVEFEMLAPEAQFVLLLPRRPRVQRLVQTQLAKVTVPVKTESYNSFFFQL